MFANSRRIITVLYAVSVNGFSVFVLVVGWIHACLRITQNVLKIVLQRAKRQSLLMLQKHPPDLPLFLRIVRIYLFKTLLALMLLLFNPAECATQDFTIEDQDHNSGLHSQDLVHDSRLNIINVNQDSRLSIQDTSLPDLIPSVHESCGFASQTHQNHMRLLSTCFARKMFHSPRRRNTLKLRLKTVM